MSGKIFTVILILVSLLNVFAATIIVHDYYCWKTQRGKCGTEQIRVYFEGESAFGSWPIEPTTPSVGFIRLRIYESDDILYISPNVITVIMKCPEFISPVDNLLHPACTAISTSAGHTYSVIEEPDYIRNLSVLLTSN